MTAQWSRSTQTEEDSDGIPYVGAQAFFYNDGTTTPRAVYSDGALTAAIAQPVLTDSSGRWPQVFVQNGLYRFLIKDAAGNTLLTVDGADPGLGSSGSGALPIVSGGTGATSAAAARNNLGAAAQSDVNAINVTIGNIQTEQTVQNNRLTDAEADITALEGTIASQPDVTGGFRQGIHVAPTSISGVNAMFPATSGALSISTVGLTADSPLIVSCGNGYGLTGAIERFGSAITNLTWTGLIPAATNYLYVDISASGVLTPGSNTLAPIYQRGGAPSSGNGQFTYQIDRGRNYVGNGIDAVNAFRVYVGEAVTDGTSVTSAAGYAIRGYAVALSGSNLPGINSSQTVNHNLGTSEFSYEITAQCVSIEGAYNVNDIAVPIGSVSAVSLPYRVIQTRTGIQVFTAASIAFSAISVGGARLDLTPANWRLRVVCRRNF